MDDKYWGYRAGKDDKDNNILYKALQGFLKVLFEKNIMEKCVAWGKEDSLLDLGKFFGVKTPSKKEMRYWMTDVS